MSREHSWDHLEKVRKSSKKSPNLDQLTTLDLCPTQICVQHISVSNIDLCPPEICVQHRSVSNTNLVPVLVPKLEGRILRAFTSQAARPPGAQEFEKWHLGDFFSTTCRQRAGDHDLEKLSILSFWAPNMAIWSLPREPQRNSTHRTICFCPKRSYQVHFAKIFHFRQIVYLRA